MKIVRAIIAGMFLVSGMAVWPQPHQQGMIENTTAPMSEKVIRQRLQMLGYSDIHIARTNTLKYRINAVKQGQSVVLDFHPQAGLIHDVTPGKAVVRPWTMPVEPPNRMRIREELQPPK
jgi:hypothetical protein